MFFDVVHDHDAYLYILLYDEILGNAIYRQALNSNYNKLTIKLNSMPLANEKSVDFVSAANRPSIDSSSIMYHTISIIRLKVGCYQLGAALIMLRYVLFILKHACSV